MIWKVKEFALRPKIQQSSVNIKKQTFPHLIRKGLIEISPTKAFKNLPKICNVLKDRQTDRVDIVHDDYKKLHKKKLNFKSKNEAVVDNYIKLRFLKFKKKKFQKIKSYHFHYLYFMEKKKLIWWKKFCFSEWEILIQINFVM